jgi:hypothetical protein
MDFDRGAVHASGVGRLTGKMDALNNVHQLELGVGVVVACMLV